MDSKDDSSSSLLFSPLPSHQSTPAQNSTPSQTHTPTPLTISAHTIEGDSKDFTEYANLDITPTPLTKPHPQHTSTHTNSSLNKENMLTTPISSAPIRVRVSAKKLREIQSPYNSSSSSSLGRGSPLLDSFKMDHPPPTLTDNQGRTGSVESSSVSLTLGECVYCWLLVHGRLIVGSLSIVSCSCAAWEAGVGYMYVSLSDQLESLSIFNVI